MSVLVVKLLYNLKKLFQRSEEGEAMYIHVPICEALINILPLILAHGLLLNNIPRLIENWICIFSTFFF